MNNFIKLFNCEECDKEKVCQYKDWEPEVYEKINTHIANTVTPDIWEFNFRCWEYKPKSNLTIK